MKSLDDKFANKTAHFVTALSDCYRDEEDMELPLIGKMNLVEEELTEDFTAMLCVMKFMYEQITGDESKDLIDFTHILNRLALQRIMKNNGKLVESEDASNG